MLISCQSCYRVRVVSRVVTRIATPTFTYGKHIYYYIMDRNMYIRHDQFCYQHILDMSNLITYDNNQKSDNKNNKDKLEYRYDYYVTYANNTKIIYIKQNE